MLTVIDRSVRARLCTPADAGRELTATLSYHCDDPLAARLLFPASATLDGSEVTWGFARDLLAAGLSAPAGDGDVHLWPCGPHRMMLELTSREGVALVELSSADVRDFLSRSYSAVPAGRESRFLDVDAALEALLDDGE